MILQGSIAGRIARTCGFEAALSDATGIAAAAGPAEFICLIARHCSGKIHAEPQSLANDFGLCPCNERRANPARMALDSSSRRKRCHFLKCADELRPTVWVACVIDAIYADENIARTKHFGPSERK